MKFSLGFRKKKLHIADATADRARAHAIATLVIYENKFHYYPPSHVGWVADKDAEFDKFIGL